MKVLLVGSGGREHAIADALVRNKALTKLFVAPGNGGMHDIATLVPIASDDIASLSAFASTERIDLTFVGPEVPLSLGIVDQFRRSGLPIVGPTAADARLESSKSFAKHFFRQHGIPTAEFVECLTAEQAYAAIDRGTFPAVIKADGLAAGKGVTIAADQKEAREAVRQLMEQRALGQAGEKLVIEEFLSGEEASFMVFADSGAFQPMVVSQDHKRRFDEDRGPNTGGMGAYSVDGILTPETRQRVLDSIVVPTLRAATTYNGVLFAGLMLTSRGPKVIEFNARFGDPETQVVLQRLETDLLDVFVDLSEQRLSQRVLSWRQGATACVTLVAGAYPGKVESGKRISGLDEAARVPETKVYHAGTRYVEGSYYTAGGRVLNDTARGATLRQALDRAYAAAEMINFEGMDYRRDIGRKGLSKEQ